MSKYMLIGSSLLMLSLVGLTGCVSVKSDKIMAPKHTYTVGQQCPSNLTVAVGETLQVTLADNPSTGFSWKLSPGLNHFEATTTYIENKKEGYLVVGAGGNRNFNFKAIAVGEEKIRLVYTRSWEPENIGAEWVCQVTVK